VILQLGLKTGCYYLRTQPKANAIQFTVDQASLAKAVREQARVLAESNKENAPVKADPTATEEDDGECLSCGA